jgi:hypothetical protein
MEAEVRDILRDAVQRDPQPKPGLGTAIAELFSGIGLKRGEAILELRGYMLREPFEP